MPLYVHHSTQTEALADALIARWRERPVDPIRPRVVIVPNAGVAQWLGLRLARVEGGWANVEFVYPRQAVRNLIAGRDLAADPGEEPWGEDAVCVVLDAIFAATLDGPLADIETQALRTYLADVRGFDGRRLSAEELMVGVGRVDLARRRQWRLAGHLAGLFDRYAVDTPDRIRAWRAGRDAAAVAGLHAVWQRLVWQRVRAVLGPSIVEMVDGWDPSTTRPPAPVECFLTAAVPPLYRSALARLAGEADVHVSLVQAAGEGPVVGINGRADRARLEAWRSAVDPIVLREVELPPTVPAAGVLPIDAGAPLTVHACHSPWREVEVARDALLAAIDDPAAEAPLRPDEILLLTPDIERYGPYIEAVFGAAYAVRERDGERRVVPSAGAIPVATAGRAMRDPDGIVLTMMDALATAFDRWTVTDLMAVARRAPIRRQLALDADALDAVESSLRGAGARWGWDAEERAAEAGPAIEANTLRQAFDRLLLAGAMDASWCAPEWRGIRPHTPLRPQALDEVARVARFAETLNALRSWLREPRTADAWQHGLALAMEQLIGSDGLDSQGAVTFSTTVADVAAEMARASDALRARGADVPLVPWEAFSDRLAQAFRARFVPVHLRSGKAVAAEFRAVADVPARVVVIVGMSDDQFPSRDPRWELDLSAEERAAACRSAVDEDRSAFLHALLAARERVIITYTGRDAQTNEERPASVVVEEVVSALASADGAAPQAVVISHPLHAWSAAPADPRRVVYAPYGRAHTTEQASPFLAGLEAPPADDGGPVEVTIEELVGYLKHPHRAWLRRQLQVSLYGRGDVPGDGLPIEWTGLEAWQVGQGLVDEPSAPALAPLTEIQRAEQRLPLGPDGGEHAAAVWERAAAVSGEQAGLAPVVQRVTAELQLPGGRPVRVTGRVRFEGQRVMFREYGSEKPKRLLTAWLHHLLANAARSTTDTVLVTGKRQGGRATAQPKPMRAVSPEAAQAILADVVAAHLDAGAPLHFVPEAAKAYYDNVTATSEDGTPRYGDREVRMAVDHSYHGEEGAGWSFPEEDASRRRFLGRGRLSASDGYDAFTRAAERIYGPFFGEEEDR